MTISLVTIVTKEPQDLDGGCCDESRASMRTRRQFQLAASKNSPWSACISVTLRACVRECALQRNKQKIDLRPKAHRPSLTACVVRLRKLQPGDPESCFRPLGHIRLRDLRRDPSPATPSAAILNEGKAEYNGRGTVMRQSQVYPVGTLHGEAAIRLEALRRQLGAPLNQDNDEQ